MINTDDSFVGQLFADRWEVLNVLGRGGMGTVYLAHDVDTDQTVALKVLNKNVKNKPRALKRFEREMKATEAIDHPNVVDVHTYGENDTGQLYLAMEYIKGDNLDTLLKKRGALPVNEALDIVTEVLWALHAAHEAGIVHRDLKPENIMVLPNNRVKVFDFGIARFMSHTPEGQKSAITAQGMIVGTPLYISPEQILGKEPDGRSDLYLIGVLIFHLIAGHPPFDHKVQMRVLHMHLKEPAPLLSSVASGIPGWLDNLVAQLLTKEPDKRPADARAVIEVIAAHPTVAPAPPRMASGGMGALYASAAAAGLGIGVLMGIAALIGAWLWLR